jgi:hypothetical protein
MSCQMHTYELVPSIEDPQTAVISTSSDLANVDSTATVRPTARRCQNRLVSQDGTCNIDMKNIRNPNRRCCCIFTPFVDMKCRYNLLLFGLAFVGSWFAFALVSTI